MTCCMLRPRFSSAARALASALLAACMADAALGFDVQDSVRAAVASGRYKSLQDIMVALEQRMPGVRVLDVDSKMDLQGALLYEVKVLERSGAKRKLLLDAATGREVAADANPKRRALDMRTLAGRLRRIEQQTGQRVAEAEFEFDDGVPAYQLWLAPSVASAQRALMAASSGELLHPVPTDDDTMHTIPEMLEAMAPNYSGLVLEVELEGVGGRQVHYELDLHQADGRKLTLHIDARTLQVLKRRLKND